MSSKKKSGKKISEKDIQKKNSPEIKNSAKTIKYVKDEKKESTTLPDRVAHKLELKKLAIPKISEAEKKILKIPKKTIKEELKFPIMPVIEEPIKPQVEEERPEPMMEETIPPIAEEISEPIAEDIIEPTTKKLVIEKKKSVIKIVTEDYQEDKNKVEALLFACGKYIDDNTISELCGIDKRGLHKILEELRQDYESKNNALMIFNEGNSWKINVREKYLSIVRKIVADTELPKSVMETLAVIAWKTPINQSEVVKIRGNKCYDHIALLEDAGFVSKEKKGRSYILKATEKFFTYFEIDHGNLKGLFDTIKVPEIKEEQKTLEQTEMIAADEKDKIAAIEVRKWTETEEEKAGHKQFLEQIENKIREAKEKNELLIQEIPKPTLEKPVEQQTMEASSETKAGSNSETSEEVIDDAIKDLESENIDQPAEDIVSKPKSLTKKQLEKKFRDELLRVREKMDSKK